MRWRNALWSTLVLVLAASVRGQAFPSTQAGQTGAGLVLDLRFRATQLDEMLPALRAVFQDVLRDSGVQPATSPARAKPQEELKLGSAKINGKPAVRFYYGGADAEKMLNAFQSRLEKLAHDRAAMSDDGAASELEKVNMELNEVSSSADEIVKLMEARQKVLADVAVDKMKALEIERQKLQMDLAAKDARARAVREQMKKLKEESREMVDEDLVKSQLQKVVQLKQKEMEATKKLVQSGNASTAELSAKETEVTEADARVAERMDAVRQSHNGDLMNRLASEVATLAIDEAEMTARYRLIAERLPPDDMKDMSEAQLKQLVDMYVVPVVDGWNMPPKWNQLMQRKNALLLRKLALELVEVKIIK